MFIQRVQVENDGFLAGLDVRLEPGLNVLIGARGTGKTSLIELIRFCLGAGAFTDDAAQRGRQQAIATLGDGAVTVTLSDGNSVYVVSRSASGRSTATENRTFSCTVLAQNEVESVGAQPGGRLHLIDRYRGKQHLEQPRLEDLRSRLASLCVEIASIVNDGIEISRQIRTLADVPVALAEARSRQEDLLQSSSATSADKDELLTLQASSQTLAEQDSILERAIAGISAFGAQLQAVNQSAQSALPSWSSNASADPLAQLRPSISRVRALIADANSEIQSALAAATSALDTNALARTAVDSQVRQLRTSLEEVQAGLEGATRRVSELEERRGQLSALESSLADRRNNLRAAIDRRSTLYLDFEGVRDGIFQERATVARSLNTELRGAIRVQVSQSDDKRDYLNQVMAGLRGSGLHYNTLAPRITELLSPYELVTLIELRRAEELADSLDITVERAASVIEALGSTALGPILTARIDDGVTLELLDGHDYKPSDRLSIGQRCTVVLPLLLGQHGDPLIIDQPEDHLDNAFIATTLVPALRARGELDQFIFSSHNANIPVLGEADHVVLMESDGDRGFVSTQGELEDPAVVSAITRLMEGGERAFHTRAEFYNRRSSGLEA